MGGRGWKGLAGFTTLLLLAYLIGPHNPWWDGACLAGAGLLAGAAIRHGTYRLPSAERLPWWCFAAGVTAHAAGTAVPAAGPLRLLLYPACVLGLVLLIRRRELRADPAAAVDTAIVGTGFALVVWVSAQALPARDGLAGLAYLVGAVALAAGVVRLVRGRGSRGAPYRWLVGSLGALAATDLIGAVLADGRPLALAGYAALGVAALQPEVAALGHPAAERAPRRSLPHLAGLTAAALVAPVVLAVQVALGRVTDGAAVAAGCTVLFLLVATRLGQLLRQLEQQHRRLLDLARTDELTGLPNRRAWDDELPRALERARRDGTRVTVAVLDLDHFAIYNDCYGHPAGDRLLKAAAAGWQPELRAVDLLARYGGEEFAVLLPGAADATAVLERLQYATPLGQTLSAGVATWDGTETSADLAARADAALSAAKAAGRNRITPAGVLV
jgi:diguanylate cyclase (GGDEF)-like protein